MKKEGITVAVATKTLVNTYCTVLFDETNVVWGVGVVFLRLDVCR